MTKEEIKQELIKRYKFIYENSQFILAQYMCERKNVEYRHIGVDSFIYLSQLPNELLLMIESLLLSDISLEKNNSYKYIKYIQGSESYRERYKKGLDLLEKKNNRYNHKILKEELDCRKLLSIIYDFISKQSNDLKNRDNKLLVIDEYIRISRYDNSSKLWTSGMKTNFKDMNNYTNYSSSGIMLNEPKKFMRDKDDIGLQSGAFIKFIADMDNHYKYNYSILTEEEKQQIYLKYHDELPWDLEIKCFFSEEEPLVRPNNTEPCNEFFTIKEEEIFIDFNLTSYRYYQLCPKCGFMVNIPNDVLSEGVKKRIEDRCKDDPALFRKMQLYSELYSLENKTEKGQRRILKKREFLD